MQYSVLDLSPVPEGHDAAEAIANTVDLARHAEAQGYRRFWMAEHHNMPGIASAATSVLIGHVAGATERIRVGAGGIMLPNHSPLMVAEAFGTLATIHGDRIDLGLGRAPGTDMATARALRRGGGNGEEFPNDVVELMNYLGAPRDGARVRALPGEGTHVPVWILGSSLYGAELAAMLGLPYAFASHFAPQALEQARELYRARFQPGALDQPRFMLAINVFAAESDARGAYLRSSMQQAFARLRLGQPGKLPRPVDDVTQILPAQAVEMADEALRITAVGGPQTVRDRLEALIAEHRPDEVILTGQIHDHEARKESFERAADILRDLGAERAAA
ncbi:LLM class flavin-dependent oxidoreductase [Tropicimonas sp. IMCC34011]|uniref:LLM class flavin-dependent oxidoreductase n=1 Tax=Tropicimonas sp. IMCC34011 TaxID=2248759 RepID=UPI000E23CCD9|nr:LLM class flavin-dependent oxidoreductase [Tropicimonas sp. IMCC34011]